ncbi:MAG: YjfB family protein [Candidatus Gastranaerophilales bacterium]|nr:YjfB family protein [Candidatus Gastranaerophilales bacterium]
MNIAGLSTAMATNSTQTQIGTAVLGKMLDTNRELGAGMVEMLDTAAMERSVNPEIGANFDMRV